MLGRWGVQFPLLIGRFNPVDLGALGASPEQLDSLRQDPLWPYPPNARRDRFPFDARDFLNDQSAYQEVEIMRNVRRMLAGNRRWMLERTRALREQVAAELDR